MKLSGHLTLLVGVLCIWTCLHNLMTLDGLSMGLKAFGWFGVAYGALLIFLWVVDMIKKKDNSPKVTPTDEQARAIIDERAELIRQISDEVMVATRRVIDRHFADREAKTEKSEPEGKS